MEALINGSYQAPREFTREIQFGYFAELSKPKNEDELKRKIRDIVVKLGFTDYRVINLQFAGLPQYQLSTLPPALLNSYFEKRLFTEDMVVQRAVNIASPFFSSSVFSHTQSAPYTSAMTQKMQAIHDLYHSFGYYDAYNIPYRTTDRTLMLSVFAQGVDPVEYKTLVEKTKLSLQLLAEAIAFAVTHRFEQALPVGCPDSIINPKPLRVLNTLANNDMTIEQVAKKLNISVVTANQHLRTIRNTLGVKSNYACIKHCVLAGIIKYDEAPK